MLRKTSRIHLGLLAVAAVFVLTGAKGEGCGGGGGGDPGDPPEPPPPLECEPGFHIETICDESCDDGACHEECVPDALCPDGTYEQWVCSDGSDVVCMGDGCPPVPDPGDCWLECIPVDPCGPGYHEEWICDEPGQCSHDKCVEGEALSADCDPGVDAICQVDPFCCDVAWDAICVMEVATVLGETCDDPANYPPQPEPWCGPICVPDENMCGPGEHEEWICEDVGPCSHDECVEGPALSPDCDLGIATICQVDPFCCDVAWDAICVSEVDTVLGQTCGDPNGYPPAPEPFCGPVCVPDGGEECPPGQHLEEICDDGGDGQPAQCQLICVDDLPNQ